MKTRILYCLSLVLTMLVTGVFWGTWFTLTRSLEVFPPDNFLRIGKTIISNVEFPMRLLMPATVLVLLLLCITQSNNRPAFFCFITSLLLILASLLITVLVEVPIDNQIKTWTVKTLPESWTDLRAKWNAFHSLRTFASILSFVMLAIGIIYPPRKAAT